LGAVIEQRAQYPQGSLGDRIAGSLLGLKCEVEQRRDRQRIVETLAAARGRSETGDPIQQTVLRDRHAGQFRQQNRAFKAHPRQPQVRSRACLKTSVKTSDEEMGLAEHVHSDFLSHVQ